MVGTAGGGGGGYQISRAENSDGTFEIFRYVHIHIDNFVDSGKKLSIYKILQEFPIFVTMLINHDYLFDNK